MHFELEADRLVAYDSPDHIMPHGTKRDNSTNPRFNRKLYALCRNEQLRVLDLGCSGGGFVRTCLDAGHLAVGLEGSDYSSRTKRAEWATIRENLFTCDVTRQYQLKLNDGDRTANATFDVVTAWELMEHIRREDLTAVCENVNRHLAKQGIWIASVSPIEDVVGGVRLHQTVEPREWWLDFFRTQRFVNHPDLVRYFGDDWVRGKLQGAPNSFHLVLTREGEAGPNLPPVTVRCRLWAGSVLANLPAHANLNWRLFRRGRGAVMRRLRSLPLP